MAPERQQHGQASLHVLQTALAQNLMFNVAPTLKDNILIHFMLREIAQYAYAIRKVEFDEKLRLTYPESAANSDARHCADVVRRHRGVVQLGFVNQWRITRIIVGSLPS